MAEENKNQAVPKAIWTSGKNYEAYIGRWSRLVGVRVLDWLDKPEGLRWLDLGCGTGILTRNILNMTAPSEIAGIDSSKGFLGLAREQVKDSRVNFVIADAQSLPFEPVYFDVAVSGLVLNFIPNPGLALNELVRVTKPGGSIAAYVWDNAGEMQMQRFFWEAATDVDPKAASQDVARRFKLCQPGPLEELFKKAGLETVAVRAIEIPTVFRDFNDYWEPFLGGQGPAPAYVATLDKTQNERLRERLRQTLPTESDGSIHLTASAWAVRGTKPG